MLRYKGQEDVCPKPSGRAQGAKLKSLIFIREATRSHKRVLSRGVTLSRLHSGTVTLVAVQAIA